MLENYRHAGIEKRSQQPIGNLHSIDVGFRKSHLRHIGHRNERPSRSIRQGTLGMDITNKGKVVLNVVFGRDGTHNVHLVSGRSACRSPEPASSPGLDVQKVYQSYASNLSALLSFAVDLEHTSAAYPLVRNGCRPMHAETA